MFDGEGKLKTVEKCKGMKKAFSRVIECLNAAPMSELNKIIIVHTNNYKGAEELSLLIKAKTGVEPEISIMGPVIGSHVGPGSVSCAWVSVKTREELMSQTYEK
jgi:fatty acid-binding protein DegV